MKRLMHGTSPINYRYFGPWGDVILTYAFQHDKMSDSKFFVLMDCAEKEWGSQCSTVSYVYHLFSSTLFAFVVRLRDKQSLLNLFKRWLQLKSCRYYFAIYWGTLPMFVNKATLKIALEASSFHLIGQWNCNLTIKRWLWRLSYPRCTGDDWSSPRSW